LELDIADTDNTIHGETASPEVVDVVDEFRLTGRADGRTLSVRVHHDVCEVISAGGGR
jgi:hypothetical protein